MSDTMAGKHLPPEGGEEGEPAVLPTETVALPGVAPQLSRPPAPAAPEGEHVTCPECGTPAQVTLNRRDAHDFCVRCDFPLFWTPSTVVLGDASAASQEALRRLPGTAGRVTIASTACPHCAEANTLSAETCVRCGGSMHPEPVAEPLPAPPPPAPEPAPQPKRTPWWVWALGGVTLALLVVLLLVLFLG